MQKPSLQTILVSVLIIVALFTSIYFPYKWKQLSNDFLGQTSHYGELLKQINDLEKEVRELRNGEGKIDELEDWKIYRNEEYGFEVKYPKDWSTANPNNWIGYTQFNKPNGEYFSITSYKDIFQFKSFNPFNSLEDYYNDSPIIEKAGNVSIAGEETQKLRVHDCPKAMHTCTQLFIEKNTHIYKIEYEDVFENKIITQILSTFKFINQEEANISDWKIYSDSNAKFTLKYPLEKPFVLVEKINSLGSAPSGYDKESALTDQQELEKGNYGEEVHSGINKKVIKIDNKYGKSFMVLVEYEICNVSFIRELIFYNNNYRVIIRLSGDKEKIISSMPEYFISGEKSCGTDEIKIWDFDNNALDNFCQTLKEGRSSEIAQNWYDTFDDIIGTIKFIEN